jgi:hypothetical protein
MKMRWSFLILARTAGQAAGAAGPARKSPCAAAFARIKADTEALDRSLRTAWQSARTDEQKEAVRAGNLRRRDKEGNALADKAVALVRRRAADPAAAEVLAWVLRYHYRTGAANEAADLLIKHHLKDPQTSRAASTFCYDPMPWTAKMLRALADAGGPREKKARALFELAECLKVQAGMPAWLGTLDAPTARLMKWRYGKDYLARLSAEQAKLEAEAVRLFRKVAREYGEIKRHTSTFGAYARAAVFEIRHLGIGKAAPDITGEDVEGVKLKLSDYWGKVVVLDFWGHW